MSGVRVGLALQPERLWLDLVTPVVRTHCDLVEVAPETLWFFDGGQIPRPNGFYRSNLALVRELGLPVVAHGVNLSVGTPDDDGRFDRWLTFIQRTHADFGFEWYSDHFGQTTTAGGEFVALPMPVPYTAERAALIRTRLDALATVVPTVGLETTAMPFWLSDPALEPAMFHAMGHHVVLDVHNLLVMSGLPGGLTPAAYLDALPLDRVIEIHVSGGSVSDPDWLPSRRSWPLDSHDTACPDGVWALLDEALARCPNVRAVILERRDGTVTAEDVPGLTRELERVRDAVQRRVLRPSGGLASPPPLPAHGADDRPLGAALRQSGPPPAGVHEDLWRLAAIQVARLRWERLLNGSGALDAAYEDDPAAFVAHFKRYHAATPATAFHPPGEVALFRAFSEAG